MPQSQSISAAIWLLNEHDTSFNKGIYKLQPYNGTLRFFAFPSFGLILTVQKIL